MGCGSSNGVQTSSINVINKANNSNVTNTALVTTALWYVSCISQFTDCSFFLLTSL